MRYFETNCTFRYYDYGCFMSFSVFFLAVSSIFVNSWEEIEVAEENYWSFVSHWSTFYNTRMINW
jgi:hypothetical protein